jgi:two-component system phosphate regulon sensor histidine kinase PhoR
MKMMKKKYRFQRQMIKHSHGKDHLHTALQALPIGVAIVNEYGDVHEINPAAATILKSTPAELRKCPLLQAIRSHRFSELLARCRKSRKGETALLERSEARPLQLTVAPFRYQREPGYVVLLQEVTQPSEPQVVSQDMVSNFAHDLQTPITTMRALVDTLNDVALQDPVAGKRFLHYLDVEVTSMTQMVQDLLDLARIESAKDQLQVVAVPVANLLWRGADRMRIQTEQAQVTLHLVTPPNLPLVFVDAERIQQVLINLIQNAIKFTAPGGEIKLSAAMTDAQTVTIKVADNGMGIAPEDLPLIFERFYKSNRPRSSSGSGLGLAIAKHIVQAHSGRIWAESQLEQGATFFFTLPAAKAAVVAKPTLPHSAALPMRPSFSA